MPHGVSVEQVAKWMADGHVRAHLDKEAAYLDLAALHQQMVDMRDANLSALGVSGSSNRAVAQVPQVPQLLPGATPASMPAGPDHTVHLFPLDLSSFIPEALSC